MKNFNVPGQMDNSEFYNNDVKGSGGVNYDGNQKNGRQGSPLITPTSGDTNVSDFGGINFDNTQTRFGSIGMTMDDNMDWEKKQGVLVNPTGKFKDVDTNKAYSVDLSKKVNCIGMPDESITGNSSTCGYGY